MQDQAPRILIVGATGYIGGSVLTELLSTSHASTRKSPISALVRSDDNVKALASKGVKGILFRSLDEGDVLERVGSEHDVIIYAGNGFHVSAPQALISGLAKRKAQTGRDVYYIQTSGTSDFADQPITNPSSISPRIYSDLDADIPTVLANLESITAYPQRTATLGVMNTGLALGVRTYIIYSPTIYGLGTGMFNTLSIQIPTLMRSALKQGHAEVLGEGKGIWHYVHIADLAMLYKGLVERCVDGYLGEGEAVPDWGEKGLFFSETGSFMWMELAERIAEAGYKLGVLKDPEVKKISLAEAAERWTGGDKHVAEDAFASNSRSRSDKSRQVLGWKPQKTEEDWKANFLEEMKLVVKE